MTDDFDQGDDELDPANFHSDGRPKRRPTGDYEVGFARPPKHTQFGSGKSGNPGGKKAGTRNFATELREEISMQVTVAMPGGKQKKISKLRANIKTIVNAGAQGNIRASRNVIDITRSTFGDTPKDDGPRKLSANDQDILDQFLSGQTDALSPAKLPPAAPSSGDDSEEHF